MKMKLTLCCNDTHMLSKQVETKFEMLLEEYNSEKLILIGMPLEKLPLNCDGLPLIVENINDYIIDNGLYEEYLFDETYSVNGRKANIISAYELVSGSRKSCKTIMDFDAVDVASVLVMWLYYLPEPLISSKQFSMICDLNVNKKKSEIMSSMNNLNRLTLQGIMNIVDSYEKQHPSYKEKLGNLFTLLLTKHADIISRNNSSQFLNNLKIVLMEAKMNNEKYNNMFNKNSLEIKSNTNQNDNDFHKNNLCNKKNSFRSLGDDGLHMKADADDVDETVKKCSTLIKSCSCNLTEFISEEDIHYNNTFKNDSSFDKSNLNTKPIDKLSDDNSYDSSICVVNEIYSSQIDDMRSIERTMQIHSRSTIKRTKNKSIKGHVERILKSGFLSNEESLLLKNTLELMKILSKIKSIQNQINIQRRCREDEFSCENGKTSKRLSELHFLNNRLEQLVNQKNIYLMKTGLSYGRSYNRTVLNLKNAQKEAFKLYENEKNNKNNQNKNFDKLISDIYNIQIVLDYLENNCGGKELPWRSSKGCPGHRKMKKKQLNCVTVVSDLQTIGEHEVMEIVAQPLFIAVEQ
ncbi:putative uncharacterized protein DDB_G0282133 isoform X2 [Rhopalosiphum maidis]|uniref:putative uncharacterized protein DDB_G0282133 isoform X2 n=1 Tax=Rhopalosiphum maidis TaxID=43146 RepID=UPI000F006E1D|nr:putative uncharacterized protein DDB_G0282133 isoform X2 [Rhopalosiphum maidis]XP_026822392.1 putative uncharacterized protein DDB_G0282133 isoform X2 [Rhopalosiphum maidis]